MMIRIQYNQHTIARISEGELECRDDNGNMLVVSFDECRRNWVDFVNKSADFTVTNLTEENTKCIGYRDIIGNPAYIELFSEPRIQFIFSSKKTVIEWLLRCPANGWRADFIYMQLLIKQIGWSTFDLS